MLILKLAADDMKVFLGSQLKAYGPHGCIAKNIIHLSWTQAEAAEIWFTGQLGYRHIIVGLAMTVHLEFLLAIEWVLCMTLPSMANITHVLILFQDTNHPGDGIGDLR